MIEKQLKLQKPKKDEFKQRKLFIRKIVWKFLLEKLSYIFFFQKRTETNTN